MSLGAKSRPDNIFDSNNLLLIKAIANQAEEISSSSQSI